MRWIHNPAYEEAPYEASFLDENGVPVSWLPPSLPMPRYDKDMHPVLAYILVDP